jgi:simple sugar transport system permease protein
MSLRQIFSEYFIPIALLALCVPMFFYSGVGTLDIANELIARIGRHGILVLALLPPLYAGMGFNFGTGLGALAAQSGFVVAVMLDLAGMPGTGLALLIGLILATALGWSAGWLLSRTPGVEMLFTVCMMALVSAGPLQLLFHALSRVVPGFARGDSYSGEISSLDLKPFLHAIDVPVQTGSITIPIGAITLVALAGLLLVWFQKTRRFEMHGNESADPRSHRVKTLAFSLSILLACLSQVIFLQGVGWINPQVIYAHPIFPVIPALVAGGATLHKARVRHAFIGMVVLNLFFILLPATLQRTCNHEELAVFVGPVLSTGLILCALIRSNRKYILSDTRSRP